MGYNGPPPEGSRPPAPPAPPPSNGYIPPPRPAPEPEPRSLFWPIVAILALLGG